MLCGLGNPIYLLHYVIKLHTFVLPRSRDLKQLDNLEVAITGAHSKRTIIDELERNYTVVGNPQGAQTLKVLCVVQHDTVVKETSGKVPAIQRNSEAETRDLLRRLHIINQVTFLSVVPHLLTLNCMPAYE